MKTSQKHLAVLVAATTTLTFTGITHANMDDQNQQKGKRITKHFKHLDTNQDKQLSLTEMLVAVEQKAEKRLQNKDNNKDGYLSFTEVSDGKKHQDLSAVSDKIVSCVTELKKSSGRADIHIPNASRFLSPKQRFDSTDTSGDGQLSQQEIKATLTNTITQKFNLMDADNSGAIDKKEFKSARQLQRMSKKALRRCVKKLRAESRLT